jgi:hypothetical protein
MEYELMEMQKRDYQDARERAAAAGKVLAANVTTLKKAKQGDTSDDKKRDR